MSNILSWFSRKNGIVQPRISRKELIKSLIVHKQIKELSSCLRTKEDRKLCITSFFELLLSIPDDKYMSDVFQLIIQKSGSKSSDLSIILSEHLSKEILTKNFDLFEKILRLPFPSLTISIPTYEMIQLIHTCPNSQQLFECLSILIEKNLPQDSEYLSWVLIILFEHYLTGDEVIIEYILNIKHVDLLLTCYGNNSVTPLMLFLHLYSNKKCQILIDQYLSNINDLSILCQRDKWNRSYLMHLLCGQCQHEIIENSLQNEELTNRCPNASAVLEKFSMFYKLGNECDTLIKAILTSGYCLSLQMILLNYLIENQSSFKFNFEEFFQHFPSRSIPNYAKYLKRLVRNQNLDSTLTSLLLSQTHTDLNDYKINFLLRQGARIHDISTVHSNIYSLLLYGRSMVPYILLDYSFYMNISYDEMLSRQNHTRLNVYICRVIQCGYPSEIREKFEEFKSTLSQNTGKIIETFIDLKTPTSLSKLCLQKLRNSLKNLGDDTIDTLKDHLRTRLRQSITNYGYDECHTYFRTAMSST